MNTALLVILVVLLGIIVYQDFKSRAISWFLIPLLVIAFIWGGLLSLDLKQFSTYFGVNLSLIIINLLGVTIFISVKEKKLTNIIDTYLGLGDVLFFLMLATVFSPINFILFFLGSIFITTIVYGLVAIASKQKQALITLAGAMSILLILTIIAEQVIPSFNFYQDILFIIE